MIELLIVVALVAIIAAVAIPGLLRARISANESATIGDVRTVISAEAAYSTANRGYYGTLECLAAPANPDCIVDYIGPTFLDPTLARATVKSGYARDASYVDIGIRTRGSASDYCYQATPMTPQQVGTRSFGGDSSGVIAFAMDARNCCEEGSLNLLSCGTLDPTPETRVFGYLRVIQVAQRKYRRESGGFYGTLECLQAPGGPNCIPSYTGKGFLTNEFVRPERYVFAAQYVNLGQPTPGSATAFCVQARPGPDQQSATRSFGADTKAIFGAHTGVDCCQRGMIDTQLCSPIM